MGELDNYIDELMGENPPEYTPTDKDWYKEDVPSEDIMSRRLVEMFEVDTLLGIADYKDYRCLYRRCRAAFDNSKGSIKAKLIDRAKSLGCCYLTLEKIRLEYLLYCAELEFACIESSKC
jgi:hypothetical protein